MRSLFSILAWIFLASISGTCTVVAQQAGRTYRVAWLWTGSPGFVQVPFETWTGPGAQIAVIIETLIGLAGNFSPWGYRIEQNVAAEYLASNPPLHA